MSRLYLYDFDKAFSKLFIPHVEQQWIDKQEEFDKQTSFKYLRNYENRIRIQINILGLKLIIDWVLGM